jgi:nicotinamidase-related amidase
MKDVALMVIDMQRRFMNQVPNAEDVLAKIKMLLRKARLAGAPVVFIYHSPENCAPVGSSPWAIHESLPVSDQDIVVRKESPCAFHSTRLKELLDAKGIKRLVLCGIATQFCLRATLLGALSLDYEVTVASDAHSSCDANCEAIAREWNPRFAGIGATVTASEDIDF